MTLYYPLYIRRSDGKLQVKSHGRAEANEPTPEQLDQSPNEKGIFDFYKLCKDDDPKLLDWRRKLGGMLIRELQPTSVVDKTKNYILAALPENYLLYEHIKYKNKPDADQKPVKNHAAGSNDRQDAYLYGHPNGRKKRYRSPNEFFPHLLWLSTDEQGDRNNCSCKFCTPEEMESGEKDKERESKPAPVPSSQPTESKPSAPALSRPGDVLKQPPKERKPIPIQQQPITTSAPAYPYRSVKPPSQQANSPASKSLEPNLLPRVRSMEQRLDCQPQKHLYRPGEVVWFKKGMAWGLGVVSRRDNAPSATSPYRIQPMSHPFSHPKTLALPHDNLRPWLAWSAPPNIAPGLRPELRNGYRVYTYDSVDWPQYIQGAYGAGDGEVDGSILAAKGVEMTYTPFDPISANPIPNTPQPQGRETHYNGIFVGAEKIWVGDALRLRASRFATDIMVLHDIVERPTMFSGNNQAANSSSGTQVTLIGDTYSIAIAELQPQSVPKDNLHLPSRVREDLAFKNELTSKKIDPKQRYTSFWQLTQKSVHLGIGHIKGRWYETATLLPVLNPAAFQQRHITGDIQDACGFMNGQGDCNRLPAGAPGAEIDPSTGQTKSQPAQVRVEKREQAFGRAVPPDFNIHRGLDERNNTPRPGSGDGNGGLSAEGRDWMDPSTRSSTAHQGTRPGSSTSAAAGGVSMEALPGFGQEYSSQDLQQGVSDTSGFKLFQDEPQGLGDMAMDQS